MHPIVELALFAPLPLATAAFLTGLLALYFGVAGAAYWLYWRRDAPASASRIQLQEPAPGQIRSEIAWSVATFSVFAVVTAGVVLLIRTNETQIYTEFGDRSAAYYAFSVAAMVLLHDAHFYWAHRLMHWRPMMRYVHWRHHRSATPSPWATFSFDPIEALVLASFIPIVIFVLPMHWTLILLFFVFMVTANVYGHLGYEIIGERIATHWLGRWITTAVHHDMHHQDGRANYGLYFNFWDSLCGTNHAGYRDRFREVVRREASGA